MSKFIVPSIPNIDQKVEYDLLYIKQEILKIYGEENIFAILLCGGFGRGEGSIIKSNDKYKPFNDYDLFLITKRRISADSLKKLGEKLAKKINIRFVDLGAIKKSRLKKMPHTIFTYDLKHSSQVIFGDNNILEKIPYFSNEEIKREEGKKILFNRLICFLELTHNSFINKKNIPIEERDKMILQISKSIIAAAVAFLVLEKKYKSSYQKQLRNFLYYCPSSKWKDLVSLAYKLKLGTICPREVDCWQYWFAARNFYLEIMKIFLNEYYNSVFLEWKNFLEFYENISLKDSIIFQLKKIIKFLIWKEPLILNTTKLKTLTEITVFLTILSLQKELNLDMNYFKLAKKYFQKVFKETKIKKIEIKNWNTAKEICNNLWSTYHH